MMDHLMAEKLTNIITAAKWGKSQQKIFKKMVSPLVEKSRLMVLSQPKPIRNTGLSKPVLNRECKQ